MKAVIQKSFLKKIAKKNYLIFGGAILGIAVLHFVLQINFIERENLRAVETSVKEIKANEPPPLISTQENTVREELKTENEEFKVGKIDNVTPAPKVVQPVVRRQTESVTPPPRVAPKKKAAPESKGERLRRAEKLLTGV